MSFRALAEKSSAVETTTIVHVMRRDKGVPPYLPVVAHRREIRRNRNKSTVRFYPCSLPGDCHAKVSPTLAMTAAVNTFPLGFHKVNIVRAGVVDLPAAARRIIFSSARSRYPNRRKRALRRRIFRSFRQRRTSRFPRGRGGKRRICRAA